MSAKLLQWVEIKRNMDSISCTTIEYARYQVFAFKLGILDYNENLNGYFHEKSLMDIQFPHR